MVDDIPSNGNVQAYIVKRQGEMLKDHETRINAIEATIDRLRGAFALPAAVLMIGNLLVIVIAIAAWFK